MIAGSALRVATTALLLAGASIAQAAVFTVDNTLDSGTGSLRQAIIDANNASGSANVIDFAIPGSGPFTIALASQLPTITGTLTIDGYSQPGSLMNTNTPDQGGLDTQLMIEIVGNGGYGFILNDTPVFVSLTVQGLCLHDFSDPIVGVGNAPDASQLNVYGNFIGTRIDGSALPGVGNSGSALRSGRGTAQIGGTQPWQRNILSGGGNFGVAIAGAAIVEGNLIGTDASGTLPIPNGTLGNNAGISIPANVANVRVGGAAPESRNVISGNHAFGIGIGNPSSGPQYVGLEIKGNYIGTDWSGTRPLPNGFTDPRDAQYGGGIQLQSNETDSTPAMIGGFAAGEANLIAFNRGAGIIAASNSAGESFDSQGNLMHHNHGVGGANIDIGSFGPTPNDPDDADSGANGVQNYPELLSASRNANQLTVTYRVDSTTANSAYPLRVDFYADAEGGGAELLGQDSYAAGDAQQARTVTLSVPPGAKSIPFVATATDADGHSSEFSPAFDVIFENDFD
ncbi:MAG: hypothetical protein WBV61_00925 [Rhodanobacteraceae bacterium]